MIKIIVKIIPMIIAGCFLYSAYANQELESKMKNYHELYAKAMEIDFCLSKVTVIKEKYQSIVKKIKGLEKCSIDSMDSNSKTSECFYLSTAAKYMINDLSEIEIPKCSSNNFNDQKFISELNSQKSKVAELPELINKNYKILAVKEVNLSLKEALVELLKDVDKMDCDIEINATIRLFTQSSNTLVNASMKGDYHSMKQIIAKILALKSRLDLVVKKCNADITDSYIARGYKTVEDRVNFFNKADPKYLLKIACKKILPLNPGSEIISLCEQGITSDYFFSTLSSFLNKK
ncbi:MAG: hypothetical protein HQK52_16560 [Oligoflexia bacterium]|nr:hypothetical protein [Oligoflexia bacterium]